VQFSPGSLLLGAATLAAQTGKDWQNSFAVDKKKLGVKGNKSLLPVDSRVPVVLQTQE
jgi:hypothetical protein